jgi:hypothetical protein
MGPVRTESALSCLRLEEAITNWKPATVGDPTTNFWIAYKGVADEYDNDLVSKYLGDLDTTLIFVSVLASLTRLIRLNHVIFCVRRVYSRPLLPRSSSNSLQPSSQIPPT